MSFLDRVQARHTKLFTGRQVGKKSFTQPPFWSIPDWAGFAGGWSTPDREKIENDYQAYIRGAYKSNGIVASCILARQQIFSQVRFGWREFKNFRPGDLFGNAELSLLEKPWLNGTTIDLLTRIEVVSSLAGNWYGTKCDDNGKIGKAATGPGQRVIELRPDWVTIIIVSPTDDFYDPRAKIGGYLFEPMGSMSGSRTPSKNSWLLMPDEVAHFHTLPDPEMRFRGMSWITPILREVQADKAATIHKEQFFKNGAQLGVIVKFPPETGVDAFDAFRARFNAAHKGEENAYATLFLGGGADVTVASANMQEVDFAKLAGGGETRVAAMAGIHPTIAGFSEGLQGSSLNSGNFGAARRLVADKTARHWWGIAASSLQTLLAPPNERATLWYETRDVAFLREDLKDLAEIQSKQAQTIRTLSDAGYVHQSIIDALVNEDWTLLKHSGLYSVQLIPPGQAGAPNPATETPAASNGNSSKPLDAVPARGLPALPAGKG